MAALEPPPRPPRPNIMVWRRRRAPRLVRVRRLLRKWST